MITFLSLLPAVVLTLLAQWGRRTRIIAFLVYFFLLLGNLLLAFMGAALLLAARTSLSRSLLSLQIAPPTLRLIGSILLATAVVSTLLMWPTVQRLLRLLMPITPGDPVHTLALVFACYLLGGSLIQAPLLATMQTLGHVSSVSRGELFGQAAAFILLAFAGVGAGLQRSWGETCQRLGLAWPRLREWRSAVTMTLGLVFLQAILGALWMVVSPQSVERVNELSQLLLGDFLNPIGAVVLGLTTGLSEELLFRGALQPRFGLIPTSILFAFVHIQYELTFALLIVFLLAIGLGLLRQRVNTTASIITHALYNTLLVFMAIVASHP